MTRAKPLCREYFLCVLFGNLNIINKTIQWILGCSHILCCFDLNICKCLRGNEICSQNTKKKSQNRDFWANKNVHIAFIWGNGKLRSKLENICFCIQMQRNEQRKTELCCKLWLEYWAVFISSGLLSDRNYGNTCWWQWQWFKDMLIEPRTNRIENGQHSIRR